mgnify:CR=1 FL=1
MTFIGFKHVFQYVVEKIRLRKRNSEKGSKIAKGHNCTIVTASINKIIQTRKTSP